MRRLAFLLGLGLFACDGLFTNNPNNCVVSESSCGPDAFCNQDTRRCETLDCTVNGGLCDATQSCSPMTRRCETRTFVLGQPDDTTNSNISHGLNFPWMSRLVPDTATGKTRLLVADTNNDRVLLWNEVPTENRPADVAIGMPDVNTISVNESYDGVSEASMAQPWSVSSDGTSLVIGDFAHHRTLIWDRIPTQMGSAAPPPATGLWGQTNFLNSQINGGASMVQKLGAQNPRGFFAQLPARDFFIVDGLNNRVLIFDTLPTSPTQLASFVLGQPDFDSNVALVSQSGLWIPRAVWADSSVIYVADSNNHRVLIFNRPITANFQPASAVLGQIDFVSNRRNGGIPPDATTLNVPLGMCAIGSGATRRLFVADHENNRVLRFTNGAPAADLVLGQMDFASILPNRGSGVAANTMLGPTDVECDAKQLVVTDYYNHRLLIYRLPLAGSGVDADVIIGQPDGVSALVNNPPTRSAFQFHGPPHVYSDGRRLFVVDANSHRVLIYNQLPQRGDTSPDVVLGQRDFAADQPNTGLGNPSESTLSSPASVAVEGERLAIADGANHRVLLWNQVPTQNFAPANFVLGQSSFAIGVPQIAELGYSGPSAVFLHEGTLYVADYQHHRVLVYRDAFRAGANPDFVLGQPDDKADVANNGGQKASSLALPAGLFVSDGKLLVADAGNHRVLLYSLPITQNFAPAEVVIGQTTFETSYTRADRTRLDFPDGLLVHEGRLYVSSATQNRILFWNQLPTTNGQRADGVLGQTDFLSTLPNNYDLPPIERLSKPAGLAAAGDHLWIADVLNNRVVARGIPKFE
jgi:hypothetical protein